MAKRKRIKKIAFVFYFLFIHSLLITVVVVSDFIPRLEYRVGTKIFPASRSIMTEHFYLMHQFHQRIDANIPPDSVIFIGDSLVQGLHTPSLYPLSVNYGIGSDTTTGVLRRISTYKSLYSCKAIVLAIGINDIRYGFTNKQILLNYEKILKKIPKDIPLIINAVLPVGRGMTKHRKDVNDQITSLNIELEKYAENKNVYFLDPKISLIDNEGYLSSQYHDGDGLHLNSKGNAIWIVELQKALSQIE